MHTLEKKKTRNKNQSIEQMVVGRLVFISFSVLFSVFMCLFVHLVSHIFTVTLGSRITTSSLHESILKARFSYLPQKFLGK